MKKNSSHGRGFTLVELIVSMGVFALIITLATGAYFVVLGVNREARATSTAIDNLAFALESMTRSIRTGTHYASSGSDFSFRDATDTHTITYSLGTNANGKGFIEKQIDSGSSDPITDSSIDIKNLGFYLQGEALSDGFQPHVTMVITGAVSPGPGVADLNFTVQTSATMRGIDD
ncbi:MAG TPA: type II secretion system protein [Candidatus Paceibacterota bacterium]|nr:type II secretion system protein [Candidatus Paceibacterota bacterium]